MQKKENQILKFLLFLLILILIGILLWRPLNNLLQNQDNLRNFILNFDILAPIVLILLVVLQILFAPIPGQIAGLAGGYIFGPILGTIYVMTGFIIGSFIVFTLSRRYGRPFVEKVVKKKTIKKFDNLVSDKGLFTLFLLYLLPVFPDDAISYIAGLSKLKIRDLIIISTIGRLPGFLILSLVGAEIVSRESNLYLVLFGILMILSFVLYLNRERLENFMIKVVKYFKK
ncbi:MAG: VTT domain-containing protein [Candidatus Pacebacteria bacterium]|nr:VTT domain-containing protein [Candidatus Paceibacterota bacterium]